MKKCFDTWGFTVAVQVRTDHGVTKWNPERIAAADQKVASVRRERHARQIAREVLA
jgi:hypothetical protein